MSRMDTKTPCLFSEQQPLSAPVEVAKAPTVEPNGCPTLAAPITARPTQPVLRERPTLSGMLAYMEEATRIVESWPQWKREVLRDPPSGVVVAEHR